MSEEVRIDFGAPVPGEAGAELAQNLRDRADVFSKEEVNNPAIAALKHVNGTNAAGQRRKALLAYVTPEDFLAPHDGESDDTAAFEDALADGRPVHLIPKWDTGTLDVVKYRVDDLVIPNGRRMIGTAVPGYHAYEGGAVLAPFSFSSCILDLSASEGCYLHGFGIDGETKAVIGIKGGSDSCIFSALDIRRCSSGLGDGVNFTKTAMVIGCTFYGNINGCRNLRDGQVFGGYFAVNDNDGYLGGPGANDNIFIGGKYEWNVRYGMNFSGSGGGGCNDQTVIAPIIDRNGWAGVKINGVDRFLMSAPNLSRNGSANAGSGKQSHVFIQGTNGSVQILDIRTVSGADDDGGGTTSPSKSIDIETGSTTSYLVITGDARGCTGEVLNQDGTVTAGRYQALGIEDMVFGQILNRDGSGDYFAKENATVATATTKTWTGIKIPFMDTFKRRPMRLSIDCRNASTEATYAGDFFFTVSRGSSTVSFQRSSIIGERGTSGKINWGSGELNFAISNITVNASDITFDLAVTNTVGVNVGVFWRLMP